MIGDKPTIFGAQTPVDQGRLRDGDLTYERPRAENRPSSFRHSASWYIVVSRRMPRDLAWKKARARVSRLFLADSPSARPWKIRREPFTSYSILETRNTWLVFGNPETIFIIRSSPLVEIDLYCNFKRIILKFRSQIAILIYPQIFFLDLFRFISQRNGKILDSNILFFFLQCNLRRW